MTLRDDSSKNAGGAVSQAISSPGPRPNPGLNPGLNPSPSLGLSPDMSQEPDRATLRESLTAALAGHPRQGEVTALLERSLGSNLISVDGDAYRPLLTSLLSGAGLFLACSAPHKLSQTAPIIRQLDDNLAGQTRLADCRCLILFVEGGTDLVLETIIEICGALQEAAPENADICFGAGINEDLPGDMVQVLLVAAP